MTTNMCITAICFVAVDPTSPKFFGFSEFLASLALMVLVWTTTDVRYRFRIATAPVPLYRLTFGVVAGIGTLTLFTDLWRAGGWLVPRGPVLTPESWQALLGGSFLLTFLTWVWFAHIRPPTFSRRNARRYADYLYVTIANGAAADMAMIGREMIRSVPQLIAATAVNVRVFQNGEEVTPDPEEWQVLARDILLLIADPRFCRALVASSPGTIHAIFQEVSNSGKHRIPIGQFGRNIVTAAIENRDSFLYHEQDGYASGLLGYIKPISQAMFGDYRMVEEIGLLLDVDHRAMCRWSEVEWSAYAGAVLIVFGSYVEKGLWNHSFVLYRAFNKIADAADDIYKIDGLDSASWEADAIRRLEMSVDFCGEALKLLNETGQPDHMKLRFREKTQHHGETVYDHLASLMLKLVQHSEAVRRSPDLSWCVRHNIVWTHLLGDFGASGRASKIVQFKLRRKIYDEIVTAEKWPNYRNIRLLGYCLQVMGLKLHDGGSFGREYRALHRAVLAWTNRNFVALQHRAPQVFDECLPAEIKYDAKGARLIRTYEVDALRTEPMHIYFNLDRPNSKNRAKNETCAVPEQ